ncbi:MAG: sigma-70 family RNA polymerase sigma factor [Thermoanaerobaculia bacterium]|nr:sigma-70 family RNA polymerase sigma factor [Thermoanaerobaculia bacterium]
MTLHYLDDKALVKRLLRGDELAFGEFFDHYYPGLFRFTLARVGRDRELAEDIAQGALCQAIRKLSTYRGEAALFSWLCTFCRHEIHAQLSRLNRRPDDVFLSEDVPEIRAALESLSSAEASGPEMELRRRELSQWVLSTLDHLPRHHARALTWKYLSDLSVKEIAQRLGLSPKAAESLLTRARASFRDVFSTLSSTGLPNPGLRSKETP